MQKGKEMPFWVSYLVVNAATTPASKGLGAANLLIVA
jgi:hypothetical protein